MGSGWVPLEWQGLKDEINFFERTLEFWADRRTVSMKHLMEELRFVLRRLRMHEEIIRERLEEGQ